MFLLTAVPRFFLHVRFKWTGTFTSVKEGIVKTGMSKNKLLPVSVAGRSEVHVAWTSLGLLDSDTFDSV